MPREGHKEGCQCVVCRKIDTKANTITVKRPQVTKLRVVRPGKEPEVTILEIPEEIPEAAIDDLVPVTDLQIGQKFRYQEAVYQLVNLTRYNATAVNLVVDEGDEGKPFPIDACVEIIKTQVIPDEEP